MKDRLVKVLRWSADKLLKAADRLEKSVIKVAEVVKKAWKEFGKHKHSIMLFTLSGLMGITLTFWLTVAVQGAWGFLAVLYAALYGILVLYFVQCGIEQWQEESKAPKKPSRSTRENVARSLGAAARSDRNVSGDNKETVSLKSLIWWATIKHTWKNRWRELKFKLNDWFQRARRHVVEHYGYYKYVLPFVLAVCSIYISNGWLLQKGFNAAVSFLLSYEAIKLFTPEEVKSAAFKTTLTGIPHYA